MAQPKKRILLLFRITILLFLAIGLYGCGASGPIYKQYSPKNSETAVVYVYRPSRSVNCCVAPAVYLNGNRQGSLKNGGYLVYELPSGEHKITVGDGSYGFTAESLEVDLEKGEYYFLKWNIGPIQNMGDVVAVAMLGSAAPGQREYNLVQVNPAIAKQEISSLKLSLP